MKIILFLSIFLSAAVFFGCSNQSPVNINDSHDAIAKVAAVSVCDYWSGLTQTGKDNAIITRASTDNNSYVGLNCKQWVDKVVFDASKNCVVVPGTAPAQYYWNVDCSGHILSMSTRIENVNRGDIIQMYLYICDKWDAKNNCTEMIYTPPILLLCLVRQQPQ